MDLSKLQQPAECIGIMANLLGSASVLPLVESAVATCESLGFSTLVLSTGNSRLEELRAWEVLSKSDCKGILAHSDYIDNESLARLLSTRKNVVMANLYDVQIGSLAAEYLISRGHRQIAVVTGAANRFSTRHRQEGFLKQAQKPLWRNVTLQYKESELSIEGGRASMESLLQMEVMPSAVFFHHEVMATGALGACKKHGLRIPQDLSFLICKDSALDRGSSNTFTAVAQPLQDLGTYAATRLVSQINGVRQIESVSNQGTARHC